LINLFCEGKLMAKVLIVDDDPDVVEAIEIILQQAGYVTASAGNADEGMVAVDRERPDLLVLDVMMEQPDDGIRMAQELRRKGFTAPILMLTSIGKVTGMSFSRDDEMVPVDAFEEKPIEPAVLVNRVKELLAKEGK
jgi:DNA-binding response OmpR family regulator